MSLTLVAAALTIMVAADTTLARATTHIFDPATGELVSVETEWFDADGRLLRRDASAADGTPALLLLMRRDDRGREAEAIYFESGQLTPSRERWTYAPDGASRELTYESPDGAAGMRIAIELDENGRNESMRYFRTDGTLFGEEEVCWLPSGRQCGWVFRYTDRPDSAAFEYQYQAESLGGIWTRRIRFRNGEPEQLEVRSLLLAHDSQNAPSLAFAPDRVSTTTANEESPSISGDGRFLLFLRSEENSAAPYYKWMHVVRLDDASLPADMTIPRGAYTAAWSADSEAVLYSTRNRTTDQVQAYRRPLMSGAGNKSDRDNADELSITGSYMSEAASGDLYFFDADGAEGPGLYRRTEAASGGAGRVEPLGEAINVRGTTNFAPHIHPDGRALLFTRYVDEDGERFGGRSGLYVTYLVGDAWSPPRQVLGLPYGWSATVSPAGDLFFTDGRDILRSSMNEIGLYWPD